MDYNLVKSINASADRSERNAKWYGDYRSRLFVSVATLMLTSSIFLFSAGAVSGVAVPEKVRMIISIFMVAGNILAARSELVMMVKQRGAIRAGKACEVKLGLEESSFDHLESGLFTESRFTLGYIAGVVYGVTLYTHFTLPT